MRLDDALGLVQRTLGKKLAHCRPTAEQVATVAEWATGRAEAVAERAFVRHLDHRDTWPGVGELDRAEGEGQGGRRPEYLGGRLVHRGPSWADTPEAQRALRHSEWLIYIADGEYETILKALRVGDTTEAEHLFKAAVGHDIETVKRIWTEAGSRGIVPAAVARRVVAELSETGMWPGRVEALRRELRDRTKAAEEGADGT